MVISAYSLEFQVAGESIEIVLADVCGHCNGDRFFEHRDEEGDFKTPCDICGATGILPTQNGAQILAMIYDMKNTKK